jgi:hypothetical protein
LPHTISWSFLLWVNFCIWYNKITQLHSFVCRYSIFSAQFVEGMSFAACGLARYASDYCSLFCPMDVYTYLYASTTMPYLFWYVSESETVRSALLFSFRLLLAIWGFWDYIWNTEFFFLFLLWDFDTNYSTLNL